jgi:hypothetical protein
MKHATLVIFGLLYIVACLFATPAIADTPAPGGVATTTPAPAPTPVAIDVQKLAQGFSNGGLWVVLLVALVAGALGGLVYELLILQGSLERPHALTDGEVTEAFSYAQPRYMYDLGFWARIVIGALAAVAALLVFKPSTALELIAMAIVAGSAGTAIFRSLQDRLTTALALKDAAETRAAAADMADKVDEASRAFAAVKDTIVTKSVSPAGVSHLAFSTDAPVLDVADLDKVGQLLNEAKGLYAKVHR